MSDTVLVVIWEIAPGQLREIPASSWGESAFDGFLRVRSEWSADTVVHINMDNIIELREMDADDYDPDGDPVEVPQGGPGVQ